MKHKLPKQARKKVVGVNAILKYKCGISGLSVQPQTEYAILNISCKINNEHTACLLLLAYSLLLMYC